MCDNTFVVISNFFMLDPGIFNVSVHIYGWSQMSSD